MKTPVLHFVFLALLGSFFTPLAVAYASPSPADSVHFSCQIIDPEEWEREQPLPAAKRTALNAGESRIVRLFYFLPEDRTERPEVVEAMKTGILEVQSFYREQMAAHGYGNKTFQIETDAQGVPIVHRVNGDYSDSHYKNRGRPESEISREFDTSSIVQLIVMDISRSSTGRGTGIKQRGQAIVDGRWDWRTAAHELGHAFGLQHDFRDDAYIMSYGADQNSLSAGAAQFLAVNPYFNSSVPLEAGSAPSVQLLSSTQYSYGATSVPVQVIVRDADGLQQVILFVKTPAGLNRPTGFNEVVSYHNLSGQTDATVTFNYKGGLPSKGDDDTSLLDQLRHTIYVSAVDKQGNRIDSPYDWTLQAINIPQANTPVSERSPQVRESIYQVVSRFQDRSVSSYEQITDAHLATISLLFVNNIHASDSPLQSNDLDGLTGLESLELRLGDGFSEESLLPAGIFAGLTSLSRLNFLYYTDIYGDDPSLYPILPLTVGLEKVGEGQFKVVVPHGAPFDMDLPLHVVNGSINGDATTITIPRGSVESAPFTVTRTPGTTAAVIVDIETLPNTSIPTNHSGYSFYRSSFPLEMFSPLAGAPTPVTERTPQVLDAIVAAVPEINHVYHDREVTYIVNGRFTEETSNFGHYVSEAHLAAITSLDVSGSSGGDLSLGGNWFSLQGNATELKPGDFDGLTNLTELRLDDNELSALPESLFDQLTNLTELKLDGNQLSALPSGLFDQLTNLTELALSNNQLSALPDGLFDQLTSLTVLTLNSNQLSALPSGLFDQLTNLTRLYLNSNQLSALPSGLFDQLANLTLLNLFDNPLSSLQESDFDHLTNLTTLILPGNSNSSNLSLEFSGDTPVCDRTPQVRDAIVAAVPGVRNCRNVTEVHLAAITDTKLELSGSSITELKPGDFDNLTNLRELGLVDNQLSSLPEDIFEYLINLEALGIANTQLSSLPDGLFENLTNLRMLFLPGNQLSSLPEGLFENQTNLTLLDLSGNQLSSLPDGLFNKVTLLDLSGNQLSSLPDGLFDRVTSILNLSDNQLSSLPDGLFKGIFDEPPDFTGFELFGNPLGPVPEDADFPTSLNLTGNPGAPLPLTVSLEKVADGQFKVVVPAGSPLYMVLPLTIGNGSISSGATTITIPAGSVESETLTITRTPGTTFAVTVDIGTLPELPSTHKGYALVKPTDLPLVFTEFGGMLSVCERTPQVRNQIWARTGMSDCRDITEAHLAAITRLDKYGGGPGYGDITALKLGDFDGLTNLRELNLHDNQLSTLPAGLFGNLNALETLNLHDNQLSSLPTGLFDNLTNLTELSLHGNQLSTLPAGLFDNLTALGTLSLYDNQLSTLPAGLFDNLTALGTLSLYDNQLSSLPTGLFDNLTALQFLRLLGNQLSTLPAGLFDNLTALQYLDLSGNQLSSLPDGLFGNLTALEGLYLYDNQLSSLPAGLFGNLTNLPELYLHDNQLSSLPAGLFGNLTNPTYIELGNNQLSSLPAGLFGNPTELFLGLNDNQLSSLPAGLFGNLTNLTYLNLTDNLINPLPLTVSLEKVAEGQFKAVAPSGAPFEMVLPLTVANGNISGGATTITIPAGSLESEPLTVTRTPGTTFAVTVDIGTLPGLPADHSGYTLVKSADLPLEIFSRLAGALTPVSERTPQVRDAILGVVRLNYPSISNYADITEIHLAGITSLYLNNSNITALQTGDFDGLTGLTELRLNGNQLTTLPADIFSGLSSLVTLDLSNNPQLSLPDGIFTGLSLTTLDLSSTPVSNVPPGALAGRPGGTDSDNQRNNASITVSLEKVGEDQVKAVAPTGAPFEIVLPLSVVNGSIDGGATTITIPSGSVESEPLTVTRTPGTTSAVTVDIGTLPGLPTNHSGYAFVKSSDLPLVLTEGNTPNESVLTLTVGAGPGAALRGYNPHSVPDWNFGSLSSRTFVLNGVSYTLYRLYYNVAGKRLDFQTSPMLRGYELHLDSHLLRSFSALDYNLHQWNNVDLNWSVGQQVQVRVVETTPIPPGAPTNFTATPGYEKVTLSWEPPTNADPTTLPVTEYEFRVSDDGGNTWNPDWDIISSSRSGQSNRTSFTIVDDIIDINLTNGTSYTFEIRARGGDGSGDAAHITAIPGGVIPVSERTPQVRDAIVAAVPGVNSADDVTEAHLAAITTFNLGGRSITALKAGDFDGLTALTKLDLAHNQLSSLSAGIFDNLNALTQLYLHHNQLSSLPADIFDNLNALTWLDLTHNQLSSLPAGIFDNLNALTQLYLFSNQLSSLPVDIFDNLNALTRLDLNDNQLSSLPADIFDNLNALTFLRLDVNQLSSLPAGIFDSLTALTHLYLYDNQLSSLPAGIFDNNTALTFLHLSSNQLSSLPDGLFDGLSSLTTLYLYGNSVDPLPLTVSLEKVGADQVKAVAPAGAPFDMVLPLTVANGNISGGATSITIPAGSLESQPLTVTRTPSTTAAVTMDIGTLPRPPTNHSGYTLVKSADLPLEVISATTPNTAAVNIPDANLRAKIETALGKTSGDPISAAEMATLTSLAAQDASISDLTGLETATNLTELQLWDNNIADIAAVAGLTKLTKLYLWGNTITDLSHVAALTNLTDLRLGENSIANVSAVAALTQLTHLHLNENSVSDISAVAALTNLTELRIGDNTISSIAAVANLTNLVWLDAPNNSISDMAVVANLTNLNSLDLSGNSISDLSAVAGLTNLLELYLAENAVSDLSPLVANTGLGADNEIDVLGNPLDYPSIYTHIPALQARSVFIDFDNRTPTTLVKISGDSQQGTSGTALAQPFVVEVQDANSVAFAGVPVTFAITAGGGTLSATNTTTDANGRAASTLTLGNSAGTNTVQVSVQGISQTATFTAEATTTDTAVGEGTDVTTYNVGDTIPLPTGFQTPRLTIGSGRAVTADNGTYTCVAAVDCIIANGAISQGTIEVTTSAVASNTDETPVVSTLPPVCDRTPQVRDAIVAAVPSVSDCNDVTEAHLAAITGTLSLIGESITALAAGDFDGLTALENLNLRVNPLTTLPAGVFEDLTALELLILADNALTTLPAGVFDGLTALTGLDLQGNELTTLPVGVFDGLTALTELWLPGNALTTLPAGVFDGLTALELLLLQGNELTTLPAGVFEDLTALTGLALSDNPGAPFAPKAVALPDDGTIPVAGGTVTLDGSGSGGPWGTNVTYGWALTSPASGVTVTFDDDTSATPVVTIPALTEGTELTFTLTVTAVPSGATGTASTPDTATVTATASTAGICGRTAEVRDALLERIEVNEGAAVACADVTDAHLTSDITSLFLNGQSITALQAGDFEDLTSLTELRLYDNQLATLPADLFDGLTALTTLYLNGNQLSTLPEGLFDGLSSLTTLYLYGNSVDPLPLTVSLEKVGADQVKAVAPAGAPFDLVLPLTVTNGSISGGATSITIPAGSLESQPLTVTRTPSTTAAVTMDIGTLPRPPTNHSGYTLVKSDDLPLEIFSLLAGGICDRTPLVQTTILRALQSQTPSPSTCGEVTEAHLAAITSLDFREQSITALQAGDFDGLTALTTLNLFDNELSSLPAGIFDNLTALTTLYLQNNQLSSLPAGIGRLTALTTLNLSHNELSSLPAGIFDNLTALTDLRLLANQLSSLPTGIGRLTALTYLQLGGNNFTMLPAGIFDNLSNLRQLYLGGNELGSLPAGIFDNLTALTTLLLGGIELSSLPAGIFDNLTTLRELQLGSNNFTTLPAGIFDNLTALTTLNLSFNQLTTLPAGIFDNLTALLTLRLHRNSVDPLPLTVSLEKVGADQVKAVAPSGAPFNLVLPLTVTNGSISGGTTTLTISKGSVESAPLTVTRTSGTTAAVTVDIGTLPGLPSNHQGYALVKSADLPLTTNTAVDESTAVTLEVAPTEVTEGAGATTITVTGTLNGAALTTATDVTLTISGTATREVDYSATVLPLTIPAGSMSGTATLTLSLVDDSVDEDDETVIITATTTTGLTLSPSALTVTITDNDTSVSTVTPVCDRTPQVRDEIVEVVPSVSDCNNVTEAHLAAIASLDLLERSITVLKAGDFDGLTALQWLWLSNNQLSSLPEGIFDNLNALTWLRLSNNQLSEAILPELGSLSNLERLYLDSNQLTGTIPAELGNLTNLTSLELSNNQLTGTIPAELGNLTNLTSLGLSNNQLTGTIPAELGNLTNLTTSLWLSNNQLTGTIPAELGNLTNLERLYLDSNQLTGTIPAELGNLTNLTSLGLSNNQLTTLPEGLFDGLTGLTRLYLNGNAVDPLPLTVSLEKVGADQFKAVAPTGAPFDMVLSLTVTNGSISGGATTITIPAGSLESESLTVVHTSGTTAAVTVDIGTLPELPTNHNGYALVKSSDLPLVFNVSDIGEVEESIVQEPDSPEQPEEVGEPRTVRLFYFLPNDRTYRAEVVEAMKTGILEVQSFYAEQMETHGYGNKTFQIETDDQGDLIVHRVDGDYPESYYISRHYFTQGEINRAYDNSANVILIVMDASRSSTILGHSYPPSKESGKVTLYEEWDWSTAAHELGHAFDLRHDFRSNAYIMSYGWADRESGQLSVCAADFLAVNPYFDSDIPLENESPPTVELISSATYPFGSVSVSVQLRVRDDDGLHQVILLSQPRDPSHPPTPAVRECRGLAGETDTVVEFNFAWRFDAAVNQHSIYVVAVDTNGNSKQVPFILESEPPPQLPPGTAITPVCDRTPQVRDAILDNISGISDCAQVTETHLVAILGLNLQNRNITALKAGDFDGLISLTWLWLQGNQLSSLPAGLFDHLDGLTMLWLQGNQLSSLPTGLFDHLDALTTLWLQGNQLTGLPEGLFDGLTALEELFLNGNQLSTLPEGLFDGLTTLTQLRLYGNSVDPLPLTVSLEKVGADQVKAVAPAGAPFDVVLPLAVANGSISGGATTLTISKGSVESTPLTVTRTSGTMAAVTVDIGTLPGLPANHSGYALVKSSDLPLEVIGATATSTARAETAVNIPDANLRAKIETALGKTSGDPISPAEMATLTALSAQDASISDLTGLETATNLTELQLWDNNIADIAAVAGLTNLTKLYLWGNAITDISHVAGLTNLTDLRLGENSIANASHVAGLTNLTHLDLRENSVSDMAAVAGLTNLTELRIGDNTISSIAAVASLTKLEWLDAPNNSISDMAVVANLTNLTSLDLSGNSISDLSAVAGLTKLLELYLAENAVSDLSPLVANTGLGADNEIDVLGNPLDYPSIYTHIPALQARSVFIEFDNRTPTTLVKVSGDSQQGTPSTALAQPFVVEVQDGESAAFTGVPVTFAITAGGGTLSATSTTTDANGQAESTLTLGNSAGTNTVRASAQGIAQTETFTAEATTTNTAVGEGTEVTTYNVGDAIPLPSGFQTARLTIGSGRAVTADNGTYTCVAAVDCIIANGAVTQGTIEVTTSAVASNNAPEFTDGVSTTLSVAENTVAGVNLGAAIAATDADNEVLTYTLGGTDAAAFAIERATGQLQTSAALDYETTSSYSVVVTVSDGSLTDTINVTINVTDLDESLIPVCDRTPQVRDAIVAVVPGVSTCGEVTKAHLTSDITSLFLNGQGITTLQAGDFEDLTSLTELPPV